MKVDKKNIDRLIKYLNNQHALLGKLSASHSKNLIQAEINGIELALLILRI